MKELAHCAHQCPVPSVRVVPVEVVVQGAPDVVLEEQRFGSRVVEHLSHRITENQVQEVSGFAGHKDGL